MNNISFYNHKYNTVESLLTRNGNVNSAILRREWFKELDICTKIKEMTRDFDIFDKFTFTDRILVIVNNIEIKTCKICGEKYVFIKKSNHMYRICNHKFNVIHSVNSNALKNSYKQKREEFQNILKKHEILMSDQDFDRRMEDMDKVKQNYAFALKRENFTFYNDLIIKTESILPLKDELEIPERIYILKHNLKSIPKCMFCDKDAYFNNRSVGFSRACSKHSVRLGIKTRIKANKDLIDKNFNFEKYEILKYPEILTRDDLVVKCKKCGCVSEWRLKNGLISLLKEKQLCRNCENPQSKMEEGLFEFLKEIYKGKIIHHTDSRKIIPPYELDFYLPERSLAIEYDGLFWHSEKGGKKDRNYHLTKTLKCEENGIRLIHIFENEWVRKHNIVKSRVLDVLGVYEKTISADECHVEEISCGCAKEFEDDNHLMGSVNSSLNLGLFHGDELVSIMTFRKPRMTKKYEWELVRFCNKLNYCVTGGVGKLLEYFEVNHDPKSLIAYADRRWSDGSVFKDLGFSLDHVSRPNYWYFARNNKLRLENRMKYQKDKQKKVLKVFDESLTEVENMRNNGYDRIFDCGNFVFVKRY